MNLRGFFGAIAEIGARSRALRTEQRPLDVGDRGSYGLAAVTGTMAAAIAADSEIFQFRWTDTTRLAVIRSVRIGAGSIVAFTAGFFKATLTVARAFTVDGTGGAAVTMATNDQKKKTAFSTTLAPSALGVRIATTAALGAGTKTFDTNPLVSLVGGVANVAGAELWRPGSEMLNPRGDRWPLVLAASEGFAIRVTVPATGTWTAGVDVEWDEVLPGEVNAQF